MRLGLMAPVLFIWLMGIGCTYDQLPEPQIGSFCDTAEVSYTHNVKPIIDLTCAIAGCHVSGTKAPGDFSNFAGLTPYLKDSEFKLYVIDLKDDTETGMPPNWDTNPGPKDLTPEQFEIIQCWVNKQYPE